MNRKVLVLVLAMGLIVGGSYIAMQSRQAVPVKVLHFGMVPEETVALDKEHWGPLVDFVAEQVGMKAELHIATDYAAAVESIKYGHTDVFQTGSFGYVIGAEEAPIEVIVGEISSETGRKDWYAYIFVRADSGITTLEGLEGQPFAFVDVNSTSGYLFPSYGLRDAGVTLGRIFYSGGHAASIAAVVNGSVVGAGTSEFRLRAAMDDGYVRKVWSVVDNVIGLPLLTDDAEVTDKDLLVLWESPGIPPTNWSVRKDMDPLMKESLIDAFLAIPEDIIWKPGVSGFVQVQDSDFDFIREVQEVVDATK